jgi:hypothetical protein
MDELFLVILPVVKGFTALDDFTSSLQFQLQLKLKLQLQFLTDMCEFVAHTIC